MQARQYLEDEYILPIITDGIKPDEWPTTRGYIDARNYTIDEIALMIRGKVEEKRAGEVINESHIMTIRDIDGTSEEVEVMLSFRLNDINKEFMIYTKNEFDAHGNTTIYAAEVDRSTGVPSLGSVKDEDWGRVKEVLRVLSQNENGLPPAFGSYFDKDGIELL